MLAIMIGYAFAIGVAYPMLDLLSFSTRGTSGCQRRTAGDYYSGDLSVAHADGPAIALSFGREARCSFGC